MEGFWVQDGGDNEMSSNGRNGDPDFSEGREICSPRGD